MTMTAEEERLIAKVPVGAIFRHYKGKQYKILHIGRNTEDLSLCVVYQGLYICDTYGDSPIWIRTLEMFLETVVINGEEVPRFELEYS